MADVYRSTTVRFLDGSEKSYDWAIMASIVVASVGIVVALCLLTGSSAGFTPDDFGLMNAYP
jgi:phage baseplate assembly protein gpV